MSELGRLITAHQDGQQYRPSLAQIAAATGVSRQLMSKWVAGTAGLPLPANLASLARALGVPYQRVLDAALVDAGYYPRQPATEGREGHGLDPAAIAAVPAAAESLSGEELGVEEPRTRRGRSPRSHEPDTPR